MTLTFPSKIAVIGAGYVGLPLALGFSKVPDLKVIAYDLNRKRIQELQKGEDRTNETDLTELKDALKRSAILFTDNKDDIKDVSFFIVTVPTPVDEYTVPDLSPLLSACETLGPVLSKNSIVVFESTVYPGLTEEILAPRLEKLSGLKYNQDFFLGYSPERVNPGDKEHSLSKVKKIVAGSTPEVLELMSAVYSKVVSVGVHKAPNIATAEAAKVIENIQRDVNIGLINELAVLCDKFGLDIYQVLEAANTKWNFLPFKPGLVGGHCIGVDPYYLTHKAKQVGYHPEMILAGRKINDSMASFFADKVLRNLVLRKISPVDASILILGFTFKENCPDTRNTKVADLVKTLISYGMQVDIVDPVADRESAKKEYGFEILSTLPKGKKYNASVFAVPHKELIDVAKKEHESFLISEGFLLDLKGLLLAGPQVIH